MKIILTTGITYKSDLPQLFGFWRPHFPDFVWKARKVAQDNRFHIEPDRVLDYVCEIIYEKKTRFEKCR
jgi:hypothetical protein